MKLVDETTILFTGDSITDCGRGRPVGQRAGLGDGYVSLVDALLSVLHPERRIRVLNTGISGNRVTDLDRRWQTDVIDLRPDWLSVMIGINDVWRQFDNLADPEQVALDRYVTTYRAILDRVRSSLTGLVLMTPYYIEASADDPMRRMMDSYGAAVNDLAADYDAVFIDVQAAFDRVLAHRPTQSLAGDRVHPNRTGHMVIARAFLDAMGVAWTPGD